LPAGKGKIIRKMNPVTLIIGTTVIVAFSWFYSVKHGRYHGIPRFFAFESIFILVLLNIHLWFRDPFSVKQIISWILLILSAYYGVAGFYLLGRHGKAGHNIEETTVLVKAGVYRYIRHPLYFSLLLLGTGTMMKDPSALQIILGIVNLAALWFTARMEEKEMISKFGDAYKQYMTETKMFIPFII
jgi:protein-S-isoprenylcysteine O-methyltransferase Ste14